MERPGRPPCAEPHLSDENQSRSRIEIAAKNALDDLELLERNASETAARVRGRNDGLRPRGLRSRRNRRRDLAGELDVQSLRRVLREEDRKTAGRAGARYLRAATPLFEIGAQRLEADEDAELKGLEAAQAKADAEIMAAEQLQAAAAARAESAGAASSRSSAIAAFRAAVQRESQHWQDHRFTQVRDLHLDPLIADEVRSNLEPFLLA